MSSTDDEANQEGGGGTPPELTGGDGYSYEDAVAAVYVAALLCETTAPGLPGHTVTHVAVQQGSFGQPLDDVIVQGRSASGTPMMLSLQVKRGLRITSAATNDDFRETIERAHKTIEANGFHAGVDRVGAVVGKISDASRDTFQTLCEWARSESSPQKFEEKLSTDGVAGAKRSQYQAVKDLLSPNVDPGELTRAAHRLLAHFVLVRLEMLTEGSQTEAQSVALLAAALALDDRPRADDLWRRLLALVRVSEGRAAGYDRKTLVTRLHGAYKLAGAPSLSAALQSLSRESRLAAADVTDSIAGVRVPRLASAEAVLQATKSPGFVQIAGVAGCGKSVVLRAAVEAALQQGPVLFLKSDRLQGASWSQYAALSGHPQADLAELLVELGAAGGKILFVDGLDRVESTHQKVVLDVLRTLEVSGVLPEWTIVATVRDSGLEPLRTWLPHSVLQHGVKVLTVDSFDDEEAKVLARAKPQLQPLLFGPDSVRAVVRRPFFAAVLVKELEVGNQPATSEVDLAALWWRRGGYAADAARAGYRRNALVQLAKAGAQQLGRRIPVEAIDAQVLAELESDGIVRPVKFGHTVKFTHDIFFEWSFLQHLIRESESWVQAVREVGEPPALGRVVELLSQAELESQENWEKYLVQLESDPTLRSQWLRSWMTGPFSLESFEVHAATFDRVLLQESSSRVGKLVVWYQAEKTRPNSDILAVVGDSGLDAATRLRFADLLGWPADVPAWRRFCTWLLDHAAQLPTTIIPDVVAAFGVWQNLASRIPNVVSQRIVRTCLAWLYYIEHVRHPKQWSSDVGPWKELRHKDDELKELEDTLRRLVLNAGISERALVAQYVQDLSRFERMPRSAVGAVFDSSPILSHACPAELADFTLRAVRQPLPVAQERRSRGEEFRVSRGFGHWDFDHLAIDDQYAFFPAAPTREPFHALLQVAPDQGRRLVREVCNHAITAWRQLQRLSYEKEGTLIPVVMRFPWGLQVFWGDFRTYVGSRGSFGPACVNSALMALELWGFNRIEAGDNVDDVLRAVLEGHKSVGVLQVAAALSLHAQHCSDVTLPIAINQRLWHWDIHRLVQESSPANEIGFMRPADLPHAKAVRASNQRGVRKVDIRSLATLMILRGGELGARAAEAIRNFPNELPFDYTQERRNEARVADLRDTAQLWGEVGDLKNYKVQATEDKSKLLVTHENPKAVGPQFDAMKQRNEELGRNLKLLNWAYSYFHDGVLKEQPSSEEAVALAKELDREDLFDTGYDHVALDHQRQSAVAGVAAIVLDKNLEEHLEWAVRISLRAAFTPEAPSEHFVRQSHLMHHPVLFAARGLRAAMKLAQDEEDQAFVQAHLTRMVSHPYEEIAIDALAGLLGAWGDHPHIGWAGLRLATSLSIVEVRFDAGSGEARRFEEIGQLVSAEIERVEAKSESVPAMPGWPQPWMQLTEAEVVPRKRRRGLLGGDDEALRWVPGRTQVDTHFLAKVLTKIPISEALQDADHAAAFLHWCEGLARWTVERVAPSWAANPRVVEDHFRANYYEWCRTFYRFLARISLHLPVQESIRRFLQPAMDKHDDAFGNLCESVTGHLVAAIADGAQIPPVALELLSAMTERILKHRDWAYAASSGRADNELVSMVKDLFFELPYAGGAVRFANRDWRDINKITHVFEPILRTHGSVEFVARFWMSLLEASSEHYPLEHFVGHLEFVLGPGGRPGGWRHTQLPARLAALIQRFSERSQLEAAVAQKLLRALDRLVDMGDRRAAAVQLSEVFRSVRVAG